MINIPIQYLRGIACMLVVVTHFIHPFLKLYCGSIGVDIFFIISGYVMLKGISRYSKDRLGYIKNRLIRIFPLYLFLSLPIFVLEFHRGNWQNILR